MRRSRWIELAMRLTRNLTNRKSYLGGNIFMLTRSLRVVMLAALFLLPASVSAQTKLLRFPDVHGDKVVFTYGGDLWTASTGGGIATRLTAHPGVEVFGKFSPDGKWIAFTGQ